MSDEAKIDPSRPFVTIELRQAREIEQLQRDLINAYRRIDELNEEKRTIAKVIRRGESYEQMQIDSVYSTPQGIVVFVC